MKYKIGDLIIVVTETRINGRRYIVTDKPAPKSKLLMGSFQIVAKNEVTQTYKIIIDDDMVGWQISQFHVDYENVAKAFNGKKFYDVVENCIVGLKNEK